MEKLFFDRIQSYIPNEFDAFLASFDRPLLRGLRVNTRKIKLSDFTEKFPYLKDPSLFCPQAFYVEQPLGNHPFHIAGLYYLQEPSASSAVEILNVQPNDVVLDLCAAPGGKSSQIASKLGNDGFLVSNEIDSKRANILLSNLERMGMMNMLVTNNNSKEICKQFKSCFTKILVDAPCSGEGMLKKHESAYDNWSYENILFCQKRQLEILSDAYETLQEDGILVYSTCTYAKEENEDVVAQFLMEHEDMELLDVSVSFGRNGLSNSQIDANKVCRIFPMDHGEGHFVAKMHKISGEKKNMLPMKPTLIPNFVRDFVEEQLNEEPTYFYKENDYIYCMNHPFINTGKLKVLRQGIQVGQIKKNRIEPCHAFYMCANWIDVWKHKLNLDLDHLDDYLHGQELAISNPKGYLAICYEGYPVGFGKSDGMHIKNKLPKGLRFLPNSHVMGK